MSLRCLERSQLEEAIAVAKAALYEVEHVSQFQEPDDLPAHFEQLKAHQEQLRLLEDELALHIRECDLCAEELPVS
jgi:hypothetical protein